MVQLHHIAGGLEAVLNRCTAAPYVKKNVHQTGENFATGFIVCGIIVARARTRPIFEGTFGMSQLPSGWTCIVLLRMLMTMR